MGVTDSVVLGSFILAAFTFEPLLAVGGIVAAIVIGLLQREDRIPIALFCLGYQWLFIVSGITYRGFFGEYPSDLKPHSINLAVILLLTTFVTLAFGLRMGLRLVRSNATWRSKWARQPEFHYSIEKLFWWTVAVFGISWIVAANPRHIHYGASQIIYRILEFRLVFIYLLFVMVLRQRRGHGYALLGGLIVAVPALGSGKSTFAQILIVLFVAMISEARIFLPGDFFRSRRRAVIVAVLGVLLFTIAILWNGAVKGPWREMVRSGRVSSSLVGQVEQFIAISTFEIKNMDAKDGFLDFAQRVSEIPVLMAYVMERVPDVIEHQQGALTYRAIRHVTMPRFLFPNKVNLGSDSVLVRKYTGLYVAGAESNTSIGLGYMVEFYIDYGPIGMAFAAFGFGFVIGVLYRSMYFFAPSKELYQGILIAVMLHHFMSFDGNLAKIAGGFLMAFVVQSGMLAVIGKRLHAHLLLSPPMMR